MLQLNPTTEQAATLKRTLDAHTACFNEVARVGFTSQCRNGIALHKETYYPLRAQHPDLPSQLVCAARVKATEAVKSALTWKRKKERDYPKKVAKSQKQGRSVPRFKPVKCPSSMSMPIRYDQRSYWLKWNLNTCSLATVAGRMKLPFAVPEHLEQYARNKTCSADLCYRKGQFTLHVVVSIPEPPIASTATVIGVDLGLSRPAVTSTRQFLGEKHWQEQERRFHRWSFAQLHAFVSYKAAMQGIQVVKIDPRHTSQTCSNCQHQHRSNRRSQSLFRCCKCGYSLNADLNASYNIREKYLSSLASSGISSARGLRSISLSSPSSDEGQAPSL